MAKSFRVLGGVKKGEKGRGKFVPLGLSVNWLLSISKTKRQKKKKRRNKKKTTWIQTKISCSYPSLNTLVILSSLLETRKTFHYVNQKLGLLFCFSVFCFLFWVHYLMYGHRILHFAVEKPLLFQKVFPV